MIIPDIPDRFRAFFIPVIGECKVIDFGETYDLDEFKEIIGASWLEFVHFDYTRYMIVDELGKVYENPKPINLRASSLYAGTAYGDPIVGDVLIVGFDGIDDICGLSATQIGVLKENFCI